MEKKGLSPIIATILLITIVVVLALIILAWALMFFGEVVEKEVGGVKKSGDQVCGEIDLQASLSGSMLSLVNRGNIPIYDIEIRTGGFGRVDIRRASDEAGWNGLGVGHSNTISGVSGEVELIPVIKGVVDNQMKLYTCVDNPITLS